MPLFKKKHKQIVQANAEIVGDMLSTNVHNATDVTIEGMELFQRKAAQLKNTPFDTAKGGLFEYIEAAKFNKDAAMKNNSARAILTDATGDPHAEADIIIKNKNKVVKEIQAKFSKTYNKGKVDDSAATSVIEQTGAKNKGWGQYHGMDRLIRKQDDYNANGSLLDEAKKLAEDRAGTKGIHADEYRDVYEHLTDETKYETVSSGGTTFEEVQDAFDDPSKYRRLIEQKQFGSELKATAANMAKASLITTGIISGVTNLFDVYNDKKELDVAIKDVTIDAVKSGAKGGATGALSTTIRYAGVKSGKVLLSDSTAAVDQHFLRDKNGVF